MREGWQEMELRLRGRGEMKYGHESLLPMIGVGRGHVLSGKESLWGIDRWRRGM